MDGTLLALDVGTTHCRAALFDDHGARIAFASCSVPVLTGADGTAEQDAEGVWRAVRGLLERVVRDGGGEGARSLSLAVQGDAIIPVGARGDVLHNAILGMDYRSEPQARAVAEALGARRVFRTTGIRPHPIASISKILWLRENRPDAYRAARRILTYEDFILGRLGAEPGIDVTMASRTMGFDLRSGDWSPWILDRLGIDRELLSPVVASGRPVARMSGPLAQSLGLPEPPLLVAGAHDQVCAALGAGVPSRGRAVVSTGTAEVLSAAFDRPALGAGMFEAHYPCYRFAKPGMYFTFTLNHCGGILLDWLGGLAAAEPAAGGQRATDRQSAADPYAWLPAEAPEGPSSLLVLPHFNGSGTPWCDMQSRGAMLGLTLSTGRREIAIGILEGLAYELRLNLDRLEDAGIPIETIAAVGGGARSAAWLQIKADVLARPIHKPQATEAAVLGAAILAGTGGGLFGSLEEGIDRMVGPATVVTPRPGASARYHDRYLAWRELYPRLAPVSRRLG